MDKKPTMKVRAKALGYYGDKRRKEGEIFDLVEREVGDAQQRRVLSVDQQFSDKWMDKVDDQGNIIESKTVTKVRPADTDVATKEVPPSTEEPEKGSSAKPADRHQATKRR